MEATRINGCEVHTFSRVSSRCRACLYKDYCDHKRLQAEAAIKTAAQKRVGELEEAERQHYQAIIERHEREIGQKGGAGA